MLALTLNFALVKLTSDELPTGEVLFLRGLIATGLIATLLVATGLHRKVGLVLHRTVVWRAASDSVSALLYFLALFRMPLADVTVIYQALPLALTAAAALFLGESVRPKRWLAILTGFAGVLVVVRPGMAGFDPASLLMVGAVLFSVSRDLATRALPRGIPTMLVTSTGLVTLSFVGLLSAPFEEWVPPSARSLLLLSCAGALLVTGIGLLVFAMRSGELSVISPFRYSSVVWAILLGSLVWGRAVDPWMALGAVIIVGSGVYISYPERRSAQRRAIERAERI